MEGKLDLARLAEIAAEEAGAGHHFRFVQLPFNLGMVEALEAKPESVLDAAGRLGITVVASASLLQARLTRELPEAIGERLPGLRTDAQRAIQFTRSTPGITVALAGMSQAAHVHREPRRGRRAAGHARAAPQALPGMTAIEVQDDLAGLDAALAEVPNRPAVFLLWPKEGDPYLARTALLRRRLLRLLKERDKPGRLLNLRHTVRRIEYHLTGSGFESSVRMYELARRHFPKTYLEILKLRMPPYVKIILNNPFPRTQVTTHLGRTPGGIFRPVPRALHRRVVRSADARPVSDAPLPGRPGAVARTSRAACMARWGCACVPARRWWGRRNTGTRWSGWSSFCAATAAPCWNRSGRRATVSAKK